MTIHLGSLLLGAQVECLSCWSRTANIKLCATLEISPWLYGFESSDIAAKWPIELAWPTPPFWRKCLATPSQIRQSYNQLVVCYWAKARLLAELFSTYCNPIENGRQRVQGAYLHTDPWSPKPTRQTYSPFCLYHPCGQRQKVILTSRWNSALNGIRIGIYDSIACALPASYLWHWLDSQALLRVKSFDTNATGYVPLLIPRALHLAVKRSFDLPKYRRNHRDRFIVGTNISCPVL